MARFDISMLGDKDLERQLRGLTEKLEKNILSKALRSAAVVVKNQAQANVRRRRVTIAAGTSQRRQRQLQRLANRFDRLANSLFVRALRRKKGRIGSAVYTGTRAQLGISSRYYYPAHVELGHGPPSHRATALTRRATRAEFGGRRTPPHPYLRPALIARRAEVLGIITTEIRRRLPIEARRP